MINAIIEDLKTELGLENDNDISVLKVKVNNAYKTVKNARNYQSCHTDDFIQADIKQFESNIHDLALYDYNQIGAEGQTAHNENGVNRTWKDRKSCLDGIVPLAKIF